MLTIPQRGLVTPQGLRARAETAAPFRFKDRTDHAADIFAKIGDLDDFEVNFGYLLVAKYIREDVGTSGVLIAAEQTKLEDKWQGKVGLVLKIGPLAFKSDANRDFGGASAKIGEWLYYSSSDGRDVDIRCLDGLNVTHCRLLHDAEIIGKVRYPDRIW